MRHPSDHRPAAFSLCFALLAAVSAGASDGAPVAKAAPPGSMRAAAPEAPRPADTPSAAVPPRAQRLKSRPPAPLKRLTYNAKDGFMLRMIAQQEMTAEIRNGAGRTLAFTSRTLEAGDWTLRPRNLAPGLYTVLLRTGPNLRALRMKIENTERGEGRPEWVLERAGDSARPPQSPPVGARSASEAAEGAPRRPGFLASAPAAFTPD